MLIYKFEEFKLILRNSKQFGYFTFRSFSWQLFDRKMAVRLDKQPGMTPEELAQLPNRLPEGLGGVGMGLVANGNPLTEVAKNISSSQVCLFASTSIAKLLFLFA